MRAAPGVGLAAPQLGEPLQACVIEVESHALRARQPADRPRRRRGPRPRGLPLDPGLRRLRHAPREGLGRRPEPRSARSIKVAGSGLLGRALQHELDHLDGKLYIDYLDSMDELIAVGREGDDEDDEDEAVRAADGGRASREPPCRRRLDRARPGASGRVFLGSGGFAVPALRRLGRAPDVELVGVVTAPPRPVGRHQAVTPTPGRAPARASSASGPCSRPTRLRAPEAVAEVLAAAARARRPRRLRPDRPAGPPRPAGTGRSTSTRRCCPGIEAPRRSRPRSSRATPRPA